LEAQKKQNGAQRFEGECEQNDITQEYMDVCLGSVRIGILNGETGTKGERAAEHDEKRRRERHDPQASQLNEREDGQLSPQSEFLSYVNNGKAGDASGGCRHEEGVNERKVLSVSHGKKLQYKSAAQDKDEEARNRVNGKRQILNQPGSQSHPQYS
jgi:hypothetical protein